MELSEWWELEWVSSPVYLFFSIEGWSCEWLISIFQVMQLLLRWYIRPERLSPLKVTAHLDSVVWKLKWFAGKFLFFNSCLTISQLSIVFFYLLNNETFLHRYRLPITIFILNNNGIYSGVDKIEDIHNIPPTALLPSAHYEKVWKWWVGFTSYSIHIH